jgi:hypothetical protein
MNHNHVTYRIAYETFIITLIFFVIFIVVFAICDITMVTHDPVTPTVTAGEPTITYHPPVERDGARIYATILE